MLVSIFYSWIIVRILMGIGNIEIPSLELEFRFKLILHLHELELEMVFRIMAQPLEDERAVYSQMNPIKGENKTASFRSSATLWGPSICDSEVEVAPVESVSGTA